MKKRKSIEVPAEHVADVLVAIVEQLILDGEIDPRGKSPDEIRSAFHQWYLDRSASGIEFAMVTDHTSTIWAKAQKAEACDELNFACLYYATWAEHRLNGIIVSLCRRRNYDEHYAQQLIRDTGFKAKILWIQCLLRRKPRKSLFDALVSLAEARNQILHYKWKPDGEDADRRHKSVLKRAKPALRYLDRIIASRLMAASKAQISRMRSKMVADHTADPVVLTAPHS